MKYSKRTFQNNINIKNLSNQDMVRKIIIKNKSFFIIASFGILVILIDYNAFVQGIFNANHRNKTAINNTNKSSLINNNNNTVISSLNRDDNKTVHFGDTPSASLFRQSFFIKGLLGDRRKPAQNQEEEEEEEVTKTIVMPIREQLDTTEGASSTRIRDNIHTTAFSSNKNQLSKGAQPKPEASLQLTSTEMNSILNDGEAPDFYKEREINGDGVLVGEERNRLWTSASDRFGGYGSSIGHSNYNGLPEGYINMNSYEGDSLMNQRLAHAASEGGFNHRFGTSFNGGGPDELSGYNQNSGRLMQSPNEYSEYNSDYNAGLGAGGYGGAGSIGPMDYSPNSGLLRAGSGEFGPEAGAGGGFIGGFRGLASGGYPSSSYGNSPILDRHASELYGAGGGDVINPGHFSSSQNNDFNSIYNGRLISAGSHIPNHHHPFSNGVQHTFGPAAVDEYSNRYGYSGGAGAGPISFDQRGFATQNNIMLRGNSMLTNSKILDSNKLVPLTPLVPIADDLILPNQGSYREASNNVERETTKLDPFDNNNRIKQQHQQQQQQQVHESLDDDASEPGDESDDNSSSYNNSNDSDDESPTRATTNSRASRGEAASLVINVPPPNIDNSIGSKPTIDFTRIGSAGYLAPNLRDHDGRSRSSNRFSKKEGLLYTISNDNNYRQVSNYDPSENPAHAGKYIID